MSQHHHADPIEENIETHPVKLAIGIVVGAFALMVGIILLAQFAVNAVIAPPAPGKTADAAGAGRAVFDKGCVVCHGTGVAGAPKPGDKAAWAPRVAQGKALLHTHALQGNGAMPAKGGNAALSDAEVKAAADYMVAASK